LFIFSSLFSGHSKLKTKEAKKPSSVRQAIESGMKHMLIRLSKVVAIMFLFARRNKLIWTTTTAGISRVSEGFIVRESQEEEWVGEKHFRLDAKVS